jgi:two-component system response regulator MprA
VRILVADDEAALVRSMARSLRFEGYDVETAADGEEALSLLTDRQPDIVILDVTMPRLDGVAVCRRMRSAGDRTPVLMLTARDTVRDRVAGLDAGADDYLVKPFAYDELLARLRALRRRNVDVGADRDLEVGPLRVVPATWEATLDDEPMSLTRTEFGLLEMFVRHSGQVLSRAQLYDAVWGGQLDLTSNSVEVYVGYLRRKLESHGRPRMIHTIRGVGYVLRVPR